MRTTVPWAPLSTTTSSSRVAATPAGAGATYGASGVPVTTGAAAGGSPREVTAGASTGGSTAATAGSAAGGSGSAAVAIVVSAPAGTSVSSSALPLADNSCSVSPWVAMTSRVKGRSPSTRRTVT